MPHQGELFFQTVRSPPTSAITATWEPANSLGIVPLKRNQNVVYAGPYSNPFVTSFHGPFSASVCVAQGLQLISIFSGARLPCKWDFSSYFRKAEMRFRV